MIRSLVGRGDILKTDYLKTSFFLPITFVCLTSFLLSFISVKLSVSIGIILSFWLIMRSKPDGLLGLFLLYFIRYYFGEAVSDDLRSGLSVGAFPLEVQTILTQNNTNSLNN